LFLKALVSVSPDRLMAFGLLLLMVTNFEAAFFSAPQGFQGGLPQ
jgi:hypothetical protein